MCDVHRNTFQFELPRSRAAREKAMGHWRPVLQDYDGDTIE